MSGASGRGALHGIRVLDLTRYLPGPCCAMMLGELGADVVKVEEPLQGDPLRGMPPIVDGDSAAHTAFNKSKRSIAVDLRHPEGASVVRRLAATADVFVEAYRPGVLARRGLGADALRGENERLIYCSLSGYGQTGSRAVRAGHDINYVALAGLLGANRDGEGRPVLPPAPLADMAGALLAVIAVLAALQARERTGRGQYVDVSLFESAFFLMMLPATRLSAGGPSAGPLSGDHACYNVYRCRDGRYLALGALEPRFWEQICRVLGLEEWIGRQWEAGEGRRETIELLSDRFAARDRDEWVRELGGLDACVEPVLELADALDDTDAGRLPGSAVPIGLSETPFRSSREAPRLGQHTDEVLRDVGYSEGDVERMRRAGVLA